MIKLNNISFSYSKKTVIDNISAEFECGKLYGILGANGSGKTTLLKLISGILKPEYGEITIDGLGITNRKIKAQKLSLMPQYRSLPDMTVWDFVACGRFPHSYHLNSKDTEIINSVLETTDLSPFKDRFLNTLSGGERQKAYLSLCLAQDTDYILLDEPTTYLDVANNYSFMEILTELKTDNKCIVSVFHDIATALKYCDELTILKDGNLCFTGTPEESMESDILKDVFGVECVKFTDGKDTYYNFKKI